MRYLLSKIAPKEKMEKYNEISRFSSVIPISGMHKGEFEYWVEKEISNSYKMYPLMDRNTVFLKKYYEFMKYFGEDQTKYNSEIDYNLKPLALIHFIEQLR